MLLSYHLYCHLHAIIVSSVLSSYIPLCSDLKFVITSLFNNDIFINDIFLYYMLLSYHLYYHQIMAHSLAEASSHHHIITSSHHHIITSSDYGTLFSRSIITPLQNRQIWTCVIRPVLMHTIMI